jgi:hypothetical protein
MQAAESIARDEAGGPCRSGLMTLDHAVSLRSGHAADARISNPETSPSGGKRHWRSQADPLNSRTWPSSRGWALSNSYVSLSQPILRCVAQSEPGRRPLRVPSDQAAAGDDHRETGQFRMALDVMRSPATGGTRRRHDRPRECQQNQRSDTQIGEIDTPCESKSAWTSFLRDRTVGR